MVTCMTCHIGEQVSAACGTCHINVERHKTAIDQFGGLPIQEQGACFTCHVLLSPYDHKIDHEKAISNVGGWQGSTMVCKKCHPRAYSDTISTVHVRLKSKVSVQGIKGEHGLITRFSPYWSYVWITHVNQCLYGQKEAYGRTENRNVSVLLLFEVST